MDGLRDLVAGGLGGLACVLAGLPLDTVKVKRQTYPEVYTSAVQAFSKTFWEEGGLRALYAGLGASASSNISENAVLFLCYERCQEIVAWTTGDSSTDGMSVTKRALAGSLASVFSSIALNPFDRLKCKMQVQTQQRQGNSKLLSHWGMAKSILREEGIKGPFRGLTSTWAREVPGYFFFFGGYNGSLWLLSPSEQNEYRQELSVWRLALAGGLAGSFFWTATFPIDVVKSRIQVNSSLRGSMWSIMWNIIRKEGVLALYRGLLPTVIRSFPANGALFITYEYTRKLFIPSSKQYC